jgi:hypothetical protein
VPPKIERALQDFAKVNPLEASTLKFREAVLETFEALVREGVLVEDLPELRTLELADTPEPIGQIEA